MKKKKSVGIITMHRPISFGSSLQAYALQRKIQDLGFDSEIIDYQYPNKLHKTKNKLYLVLVRSFFHYVLNLFMGMPCLIEYIRFKRFRKRFLKLSKYFKDSESLAKNPPEYDIYCTGSDQVWNTNFTKQDTSFILSFVKDKNKISYASSFAVDYVIEDCIKDFEYCLSQYAMISVREKSGIELVNKLAGKSATLVCDPTLLLSKEEWFPLASQSHIHIQEPYLLVFILTYSYNPYPGVNRIIDNIQQKLGLHTVILSGNKYDYLRKNTTVIKSAGPLEFLYLFKNASFIITSSFHGVAFSANFEKPFLAVVDRKNNDSRLLSFLETINMMDRAIGYDEENVNLDLSVPNTSALESFRNFSINHLKDTLLKIRV